MHLYQEQNNEENAVDNMTQQENSMDSSQKTSTPKKTDAGVGTDPNKKMTPENEKTKQDSQKARDDRISEIGQTTLDKNSKKVRIHLLTIIGEIEGHEALPSQNKSTKYEHVLPQLAAIEDSDEIDGLLLLLNTVGGDVEAGLAIAEMIASLSKPTVSLVLGGSHSIGVPLAVSTQYSFIVPTATMIVHPVRMNGTVIGVRQTYEYIEKIQDRILSFISNHSKISYDEVKKLMLNTEQLVKDFGSILVGKDAVDQGIIDEIGGIDVALKKLTEMIEERKQSQ